jgi:radical SAM protein with 4Fe4S-binding SPASM domain
MTDESYEKVTGIPNAFSRVDRAIDLLLDRGIRVELKCPAMTLTVDELPAMKAYAAARGIEFRYDPIITPQEKGDTRPMRLQLAPKRVLELDEQMDEGFKEFSGFAEKFSEPGNASVYRCGGGRIAVSVNVKGGISTCLSSRQAVGNMFEQPFSEVWEMLGGKVAKKFPDGHPCATCRFRTICAGCPATVEEATGLPEGYVQQYCQITHLRAHRIGLHPTGIPRTVTEGIPAHIRTPGREAARALPVLS